MRLPGIEARFVHLDHQRRMIDPTRSFQPSTPLQEDVALEHAGGGLTAPEGFVHAHASGFPPFDPDTGKVMEAPIERQTELVLEQMKHCLETAGSSLKNVLKCNVYCTSVEKFAAVNAVYARYFPDDPPARAFVCVPAWPGTFDIEIDCIATR
jgi:2-iminobutanoate/2-iminopropanoate deaminase